jgi:hypothetical protein
VVAEHHADRRIEDLGRHAVAVLIGRAQRRVPAARVPVVEAAGEIGLASRGGDEPIGIVVCRPGIT